MGNKRWCRCPGRCRCESNRTIGGVAIFVLQALAPRAHQRMQGGGGQGWENGLPQCNGGNRWRCKSMPHLLLKQVPVRPTESRPRKAEADKAGASRKRQNRCGSACCASTFGSTARVPTAVITTSAITAGLEARCRCSNRCWCGCHGRCRCEKNRAVCTEQGNLPFHRATGGCRSRCTWQGGCRWRCSKWQGGCRQYIPEYGSIHACGLAAARIPTRGITAGKDFGLI